MRRPSRVTLEDVVRAAIVYAVPAAVVTAAWVRLERPHSPGPGVLVALLALAPALVPGVRARIALALVAALCATRVAVGVWAVGHPIRAAARFGDGFLDFYDVALPFDPRTHHAMEGTILLGVFAFCLALALCVAARRPLVAVLVLLAGAGWPATLLTGDRELQRGTLILGGALVLLAGLARRPVPRLALPAAAVLMLAAATVSTSSAVAKGGVVDWQHWDPYTRPQAPVSVSYVWDAQYEGIRFPAKRTTVFTVKAPRTSLYWRATTLDLFAGDRWVEHGGFRDAMSGRRWVEQQGERADREPLHPARLVKQEVTIEALEDTHLVGGSVPVRFDAGDAPIVQPRPGVALLPSGVTRGLRYSVWSNAPQPTPAELLRAPARYPAALTRSGGELDVAPGSPAPAWGARDRDGRLARIFAASWSASNYQPLARQARTLAAGARSPYAAAVALESWFRLRGGFVYSNHPPVPSSAPALVGFVVQTRSGYCQYYAGAMALMLRYLGVPARVAVGFTSGRYRKGTWTVTDHDAHAWVEAWFPGYGWLPFDPTPGRGRLSAAYSAGSTAFAKLARSGVLAAGLGLLDTADLKMNRDLAQRGVDGTGAPGAADPRRGSARTLAAPARHGSLLKLLALMLLAALLAVWLAKLAMRRGRYLTRDPRRVAAACRHELAAYLADQRIDAARSATLHELGSLVGGELSVDASAFVAAANAARFGPVDAAPSAAVRARRELRALVRRIRRRLTLRERARGLVSLRSLGFTG